MIESASPGLAARDLARHGVAYAPEIARAAQRYGVNPALLAAVAAQETGGPGRARAATSSATADTGAASFRSTIAGTHSRAVLRP